MALGDETIDKIDRKNAGLYQLGKSIGGGLEGQARSNADWIDRTGNTRRAIHGGADKTTLGTTVYLAHGSKVGLFFEEGTKPHEIRPKNKKALRFNVGGNTVFAKKVNHPGMKARPIVEPTVDSSWADIKKQVRKYWENV